MDELTRAPKKKTTKKKTTKKKSSTSIRLTAEEKKIIQNYRKCNLLEKMIIRTLTEKASGELSKLVNVERLMNQ